MPEEVLKEAAEEMLDYQRFRNVRDGNESHRSKAFDQIIRTAEQDLRDLMQIPDNYKVLFLQGGALPAVCGMIPMNLMKNRVADYIVTGQWAKKAWQGGAEIRKGQQASPLPRTRPFPISRTAAIFLSARMRIMYTSVKTIPFTEQNSKTLPNTKGKTLVADVSSCFLVRAGGCEQNTA